MRRETGRLQLHRNTFKYCKRFELLRIINLSTLNGEMDIIWLISLVMAAVSLAAVAMAVVMHCITDAYCIWNGVKAKVILINSLSYVQKIKNEIADSAHLRMHFTKLISSGKLTMNITVIVATYAFRTSTRESYSCAFTS